MGFLDRAIKNGISSAVSSAVEQTVKTVVQPKIDQAAANAANKAAGRINEAVGVTEEAAAQVPPGALNTDEVTKAAGTLGGIFGSLQTAAMGMATEAARNMKICPACEEATTADKIFCPSCGAKLPEETIAQGALCSQCGTQNEIGTKFCASCGAKLPAAAAEEEKFLADWDRYLPNYPKWRFGGTEPYIEELGTDEKGRPYYCFGVNRTSLDALKQYKELLKQNGFKKPVRYTIEEDLYKVIDGVSYDVNFSEPFSSDEGQLSLYFSIREFDETPEEKKPQTPQLDLGDLKKLFKF